MSVEFGSLVEVRSGIVVADNVFGEVDGDISERLLDGDDVAVILLRLVLLPAVGVSFVEVAVFGEADVDIAELLYVAVGVSSRVSLIVRFAVGVRTRPEQSTALMLVPPYATFPHLPSVVTIPAWDKPVSNIVGGFNQGQM